MKNHWRILITLLIFVIPLGFGLLITYEVIPFDWISQMQIQRSFRPMEDPLPLPEESVPIQGEVYVSGTGKLENPIPADEESIARGQEMYEIHCLVCHGPEGRGEGTVSTYFQEKKPADLTADNVLMENDGAIFMTITDGVGETMPALRGNLSVEDRWHVVNYVKTLGE